MVVPLLDLKLQFESLREAIRREVDEIVESQQFILGPKVTEFEEALRGYCGAGHAVGVSSGTDALLLILMALGIGPGDAVITTPYTFFATAGGIARVGATPVFVDIDPATYNMSVEGLRACVEKQCKPDGNGGLATAGGQRVRAVMPIHLFGLAAAMDEISELAAKFSLPVLEDAAQALGADYPSAKAGARHAGSIGEFGYFSFFPSKNLGCLGDGGAVTCRDEAMAMKMRALRNHGMEQRYYHRFIGGNFRLDALQAGVLRVKLPYLDGWSAARRRNAGLYRRLFADLQLEEFLTLPSEPYAESGIENHHIYNQFVVRAPQRGDLCRHLDARGIGHAIYYPVSLHLQECFAYLGYKVEDFPESEKAAEETLALPIYPELTGEQQEYVARALADFYRR